TTFTCPSISDQENEEVTCGRLFGFNCCRHCHHHSSVRVAQGRGHKRISASLTGLHSLDPESTGLISQSGTCTPKPQLSSSLRSSCASLCSVCHQVVSLETNSTGHAVHQHRSINGEGVQCSVNANVNSKLNCSTGSSKK